MTEKVKNLLSMIISAVGMVALVLTTVFCLVTPESIRKDPNTITSPTDYQVSASPLIKSGGVVDPVVLSALLGKVGALESSSSKTQKNLGELNSGNPVTLKLFDTVSDTTNSINLLTAKYWQPVYRTGNILTLWMVEPYTTAQFNDSTSKGKDYVSSDIQKLMVSTYDTLNTTFNLNTKNFVATPNDLPVPWQTGLPQLDTTKWPTSGSGYDAQNNLMDGGLESDKLWLPSYAEVFNNTTGAWTQDLSNLSVRNGIWQTTYRDRAYTNNSTSDYDWLRSAYSYTNYAGACGIGNDGSSNYWDVNGTNGVRPALHLNLSSLATAANLKGDVISGSLIKSGGAVDAATLATLVDKMNGLEPTGSTAMKDLSQINGGTPLTLKLFDTVADTTNALDKLTASYWQVVYRTGNVLTLWMTAPYTTSRFHSANVEAGKNYVASDTIRPLMNNTYTTLDTTFNLNTKNFVATPNDLPVPWQTGSPQKDSTKWSTNTSDTSTADNNLMDGGLESDKLWLPSYAEVFNNTTGTFTINYSDLTVRNGLWQTNYRDRSYTYNSTSNYAWLRSANSDADYTGACLVSNDGDYGAYDVRYADGVRPALHLNLEALSNTKGGLISGDPLIKSGGVVDADVLTALLAKVGNLEASDSTTQKHMGQINSGTPLTLKLFDTVADTTNDLNKLTASYWQVVYRTGNVLTLWMTAPYTTAQFNDSESKGKDYVSSDIQKLMTSTYTTLDTTFNLNNKNFVATPNDLPVPWQTNASYQPDSTKYGGDEGQNNLMDGGLESDRLWLPSWAEVFNNDPNTSSYGGTASIWKTTSATRAFTNSTANYAWLRSAYSSLTSACYVHSSGGYDANYVGLTYGVRPALHLNLEELSKLEMIVQAQPTEGGTVTGGGRVTPGESVTLTATPTPPYTFRGWYENGITLLSTEPTYTFTPSRSMNIVGLFYAAGGYEAEAISADSTMGTAALKSVKGTTAIFIAIPNPGYTFTGWFTAATGGSAVSTANPYTVNMTGDTTLYARFALSSGSNLLLFAPSTGGETRIVSGTGNLNSEIIIVAVPYVGYSFGGWINVATGATISNEPTYKFTITGALTLRANFVVQTFTASSLSINHAADLVKLANLVNSGQTLAGVTVTLETDVDIGALSREWETIGTASTKFAGIFQGNGHKITNSGAANLNLFTTGTTAQVYNLQLGEKVVAGATIQSNGLLPTGPQTDDWATINPGGR